MPITSSTFLSDMSGFTQTSLAWCATESETEAGRIFASLQALMDDIKRRSSMSETALLAVARVQNQLTAKNGSSRQDITKLITVLTRFSTDHADVADLISPLIEALQFQDRLRQNLENIGKLMAVWLQHRAGVSTAVGDPLHTLGTDLLKCMTTKEERDTIRSMIEGLPEEIMVVDDALLF